MGHNRHNKRNWILVSAVVAASFLIALSCISLGLDFLGLRSKSDEVSIEVKDANIKMMAKTLKQEGVINNKTAFVLYEKLYRKMNKDLGSYREGRFLLSPTMSYNSIIRILTMPQAQTVQVTLNEGMSVHDIAGKLEEEKVCRKDHFLQTLEHDEFDFWFLKEIPHNELRVNRFEGYLYPDTYEFYKGESPRTVLKKIFENFDLKMTKELQQQVSKSDFTLDEVIILASIVQKEEGGGEFSPSIASVFLNRLNEPAGLHTLNSDVTIIYVEKQIKPYMKYQNQEINDAYNTYKCKGLPAGPICNPGQTSIDAVLNPASTKYYFFVVDREGKYYWAKTLTEHEENVRKARRI